MMEHEGGQHAERDASGRQRGRDLNPKVVAGLVLAALLVLFGVLNGDKVSVDFIVTTKRAPLIAVIALSAVLGALITTLMQWHARRRD